MCPFLILTRRNFGSMCYASAFNLRTNFISDFIFKVQGILEDLAGILDS